MKRFNTVTYSGQHPQNTPVQTLARALLSLLVDSLAFHHGYTMLFGLIDRASSAAALKTSLDSSVQRSRVIADRVAQASVNNGDGFSLNAKTGDANAAGGEAANDINVEDEMVALGDEQMRFLATSRLLEKTYASLRSAIKGER